VLWGVALFVGTFVVSLAAVAVILVKLPVRYFCRHDRVRAFAWAERHPVWRWAAILAKNLLGLVLIVAGAVMLVTPGQGVLTILIGVMLLNFPGKRRLERKLVSRPRVLAAINRLRQRFNKPPLVLDDAACAAQPTEQVLDAGAPR
jgi:hypothetical protein